MSTQEIFICGRRDIKITSTQPFEMGDRFDEDGVLKRGEMNESSVRVWKNHGFVIPLTRENYANMIAHRPEGTIGRGFTKAELVTMGIIDADDVATPANQVPVREKAPKPAKEKRSGPDMTPIRGEAFQHNGHVITTIKQGRFTLWETTNSAGELLRDKNFRKREDAEAFIDDLVARGNSAKSGPQATEQRDDGHLQPGSVDPD